MTFRPYVEISLSSIGKASQLRISFAKEFQTLALKFEVYLFINT